MLNYRIDFTQVLIPQWNGVVLPDCWCPDLLVVEYVSGNVKLSDIGESRNSIGEDDVR